MLPKFDSYPISKLANSQPRDNPSRLELPVTQSLEGDIDI